MARTTALREKVSSMGRGDATSEHRLLLVERQSRIGLMLLLCGFALLVASPALGGSIATGAALLIATSGLLVIWRALRGVSLNRPR